MAEASLSPHESLQLIQSMIAKTRKDMGDNSLHFLLWGWITFTCCIGQFILKNLLGYEKHYLVWLLVFPTAIVSAIIGIKESKRRASTTYIGDSMKYLWTGMGISYFVLSMILSRMGWGISIFPFFILLYGLGTFVSGKFLQFKPLVFGGLIAWALAVTSTFFNYDYQMLFGATSILVSYIIPAYMLRSKNKATQR
jgi:hypothetical protein